MEDKEKKKLLKVLKGSRLCRRLGEKEIKSLLEQKGTIKIFSRGERIFQEMDQELVMDQ